MTENKSWSFTTFEDGERAETVHGLSHDQAVEAIRAAMYGRPSTQVEAEEQVAQPIAA